MLAGAVGGGVIGAIVGCALAALVYTVFYPIGLQRVGEAMYPIYVVAIGIAGSIGLLIGVAWAASWFPFGSDPSTRP
jgi:hypothetical protein